MKDLLGLELEIDLNVDLSIPRKFLRTLNEVPPSIWEAIEEVVKGIAHERAVRITRFSVSEKTKQWRKRKAKSKNPTVETYKGTFSPVLTGSRVGKRTSTFVDALRNSESPGVEYGVFTDSNIANGSFFYHIVAERFAQEYPSLFAEYLISRGIIPEGGYMDLDSQTEELILDDLERIISDYLGIEFVNAKWTG